MTHSTRRLYAAGVAALALLSACGRQTPSPPPLPRPVQIAVATQDTVTVYADSFGTLAAYTLVDVRAQVTGKLATNFFLEGQFVSNGAPLFLIETNDYAAALLKAQAALDQSDADLQRKHDTYVRNKELRDRQVISADEFERYAADYREAQATYRMCAAELELARINLERCVVRAPLSGYASKQLVDAGNVVPANTGPVLVTLRRPDPLLLDFTIPERFLHSVRAALTQRLVYATLSPEAQPHLTFTGTVDFIENTVDDRTGTIALRAVVPNPHHTLWPGEFMRVRLVYDQLTNAVLVPYAAVQLTQQGSAVFVISNNTAQLRPVTSGLRSGDNIVIHSGVAPGEHVVTVGQMGLIPGCAVEIVAPSAPAPRAATL